VAVFASGTRSDDARTTVIDLKEIGTGMGIGVAAGANPRRQGI